MDVTVWLRSLGLGKYEAIFRENDIDETVLPSLTHETLTQQPVTGSSCSMLSLWCVVIPTATPRTCGS
jgi:SAM domain (Sterile alpha motif)